MNYCLAQLNHGAVVIVMPAEEEVLDADAAAVGTRQEHGAAVHGLQVVDFPYRHLQRLSVPHSEKQHNGDSGVDHIAGPGRTAQDRPTIPPGLHVRLSVCLSV
uniref:Uncharacterized protein n=1 Tax=Anguilla anguilla TaxID=7936 RepID=A0A0E9UT44_ANGAN